MCSQYRSCCASDQVCKRNKPRAIYTRGIRTFGNLSYKSRTIIQSTHTFIHLNFIGHSDNFDDFKILSSWSDACEWMFHESILVFRLKPNVQGSFIPRNLLYNQHFLIVPEGNSRNVYPLSLNSRSTISTATLYSLLAYQMCPIYPTNQ